jgi:hypothetical protein
MRLIVMQAFFGAAALIVGFSTASSATSLSVSANKFTYSIGETITLTVRGDPQGATSYSVFGVLRYNGALVDNGTRTQPLLSGPAGPWINGTLAQADTNANDGGSFSYAFSQITVPPQTATNIPGVTLATVTLIAKALGVVTVSWDQAGGRYQLDFFGLMSAPGTSFCIPDIEISTFCDVVPEPGTGLLVIAGLLGLGVRRRADD